MLAMRGETVAVIEESAQMYGGTCINVGCIPSKSLIVNGEKHMPFKDAVAVKTTLVEKLRSKNYHMIADEHSATVIDGRARFLSDKEIEVTTPGQATRLITGGRIFINTGATPVVPPIAGLKESKHVVTSKEIMELAFLPEHLVIIGGGYVGLEFASMFHEYGSQVTIIEGSNTFLPREDEDVALRIQQDMVNSGIRFEFGAAVNKVTDTGRKVEISITDKQGERAITADKILVATGRRPNVENLGLENAGIELTERGAVKVNAQLKTNVGNIWAMGDVRGGLQFTYISLDDFRIIESQLFGDGSYTLNDQNVVPFSVFITPTLSNVGLTEREAQKRGIEYKLFKLETASVPKAQIFGDARGFFKAMIDPVTNQILGASIYARESHEVINLIALAMRAKLPYTMLRNQIYTHPTISEALNDLFK